MDDYEDYDDDLFKLHFGVPLSPVSSNYDDANSESSSFEAYRPKPYSYEEIKSRVAVVKASPSTSNIKAKDGETNDLGTTHDPIQAKLKSLTQQDYCHICNADLQNDSIRTEHYKSKRHAKKVNNWHEMEKLEQIKEIHSDLTRDFEEEITEELLKLMRPLECKLCDTHWKDEKTGKTHFISKEHAETVDFWYKVKKTEREVREKEEQKLEEGKRLDEKLKSLLTPQLCPLCDIQFKSNFNATQHYESKKHNDRVKLWYEAESKKEEDNHNLSDFAEGKTVEKNSKHHERKSNKGREESHFCSKPTVDTRACEGIKEAEGKNILHAKDSTQDYGDSMNEKLRQLITSWHCKICNTYFGLNDTKSKAHYTSVAHIDNVDKWCLSERENQNDNDRLGEGDKANQDLMKDYIEVRKESLETLLTSWKCKICNIDLLDENMTNDHYKSLSHSTNAKAWCHTKQIANTGSSQFYCHICQTHFYQSENLDKHAWSFSHQELLKLVMILIKEKIPIQRYWINCFKKLVSNTKCDFCHIYFNESHKNFYHATLDDHRQRIKYWVEQNKHYSSVGAPDAVDKTACFCATCEKELDGTTRAVGHYTGYYHDRHLRTYCPPCKIQCFNTSSYYQHLRTSSHIKNSLTITHSQKEGSSVSNGSPNANLQKGNTDNILTCNQSNDIAKNNDGNNNYQTKQDTVFEVLNKEVANLDDAVSQEFKKLADTIYHSKKIPPEIALQYLQKFNRELDNLKYNSEKNVKEQSTKKENEPILEENKIDDPEKKLSVSKPNVNEKRNFQLSVTGTNSDFLEYYTDKAERQKQIQNNTQLDNKQNELDSKDQDVKKDSLKFGVQDPNEMKISIKKPDKDEQIKFDDNISSPPYSKDIQNIKSNDIVKNQFVPFLQGIKIIQTDPATKTKVEAVENDIINGNDVLDELNKLVDSISDGVLENSVILKCLRGFNTELDNYLE